MNTQGLANRKEIKRVTRGQVYYRLRERALVAEKQATEALATQKSLVTENAQLREQNAQLRKQIDTLKSGLDGQE